MDASTVPTEPLEGEPQQLQQELERREEVLSQYRVASRRARAIAGKALAEIRSQRLYEAAGYNNFIEYCWQRWQLGRSAAYALADLGSFCLAEPSSEQKNSGTPENPLPSEKQLRVLKQVRAPSKEDGDHWRRRVVAWQAVTSKCGTGVGPQELAKELVTELLIAPRSKHSKLTPSQKLERDLSRRRAVFERRFKAIVNSMLPEDFAEELGPVDEVEWFTQLEDWVQRAREASS